MKKLVLFGVIAIFCLAAHAQVANPAQPMPSRTPAPTPVGVPAQMTPIPVELNNALLQLEQTAQQTAMDVGKLAIRKWKAESSYKNQSQHDVDSIQRNVTGTLPGLVGQVRANPEDVAAMFRLYRNVDALWDVLRALTESAGAFGSKSDYEMMEGDARNLSTVRNNLAIHLDAVATAQQGEIDRLKARVQQAQAAAAPVAPPKKIIVDDNQPAKKPAKSKAAAKPKTSQPPPTAPATKQ